MRTNLASPAGDLGWKLQQTLASIERAFQRLDQTKLGKVTDFTAPAAYSAQTAEAAYTQATIQTLMDAVLDLQTVVSAIVTDLNAGN